MTKNSNDPNLVILPTRGSQSADRSADLSSTQGTQGAQRDTTILTAIFREFEGAIARVHGLEEALRTSQTSLLRAQTEFEARNNGRHGGETERLRQYEAALRAAREELRAQEKLHEKALATSARDLQKKHDEKHAAIVKRVEMLSEQLKTGAMKWNNLIASVKNQNEQIARYRNDAEQLRAKLSIEGQSEKARRIDAEQKASKAEAELAELREKQQQLQTELIDAMMRGSGVDTELNRYKTGYQTIKHACEERDRRIAALTQETHRLRQAVSAARALTTVEFMADSEVSQAASALGSIHGGREQAQEKLKSSERALMGPPRKPGAAVQPPRAKAPPAATASLPRTAKLPSSRPDPLRK
jgi:chromosome segregation ATPase